MAKREASWGGVGGAGNSNRGTTGRGDGGYGSGRGPMWME